ncbi:MAG: hypothetical protein IPM36_17050 [Lewinellaceae bacterium]|nr:hypothetical protein [Lewinellaceae bacterium]
MHNIWQNILQTAVAGSDRRPVAEADRLALSLPPAADAAQTALQALAAVKLLHQAARPLAAGPVVLPEPCPPDSRPLVPAGVISLLPVLLADDGFPEALPEFFEYLERRGWRLPPEGVPQLLDWAARKRRLPEALRNSLGAPGQWLAVQHPDWQALYPQEKPDWETGTFPERLQLLRHLRQTQPRTGLAWLEKTWAQERAEHRLQFLQILRTGLASADEALLELARADRSRQVRFWAWRLLLLLPDSRLRQTLQNWLETLAVAGAKPGRLLAGLEKHLPAEGDFSKMQLQALAAEKNAGVLSVLLEILPLEDLAQNTGMAPEALLAAMLNESNLDENQCTGLLENIAWRADPNWLRATAHFFTQNPAHPLWSTAALAAVLNALPLTHWLTCTTALAAQPRLLEAEQSALVRALLVSEFRWPDALLQALAYYPLRTDQPRHWKPPAHFKALLQRAGYRCAIPAGLALKIDAPDCPFAWYGELVQFKKVLEFRQRLTLAFSEEYGK